MTKSNSIDQVSARVHNRFVADSFESENRSTCLSLSLCFQRIWGHTRDFILSPSCNPLSFFFHVHITLNISLEAFPAHETVGGEASAEEAVRSDAAVT